MKEEKLSVCPVELAGPLDSRLRRYIQNPRKILSPYVKEGMTALDIGCGPGFFTIEMAHLVSNTGKVIAADLQDGMLEIIRKKIHRTKLEERIHLIKCDTDRLNVPEKVDFILAFYMVHEVPDKDKLFEQMENILNKDGLVLLIEPKLFHVTRKEFDLTLKTAERKGFKPVPGPKVLLSWSSVLTRRS